MPEEKPIIDLDTYKYCCYTYGMVLNGTHTNNDLIVDATAAFQEAYVLMLDQGFDNQKLKNIFRDIMQEVKAEMSKNDPAV